MSFFSEMLDKQIVESGLKVGELAEKSGMDRTYIAKMRSGERLPRDQEKVTRLVAALRRPAEQESALLREYRVELIGRGRYEKLRATKELIESIGSAPQTPFVKGGETEIPAVGAIYGEADVLGILSLILLRETALESGHIRMIAQPEYTGLFSSLHHAIRNHAKLVVEHVVCLQSADADRQDFYNVDCLRQLIPSVTSGCDYRLLYYYDDVHAHVNSASPFPYLILTSTHAIQISYDGSMAYLHHTEDAHQLFSNMFSQFQKIARPLIQRITLDKMLGVRGIFAEKHMGIPAHAVGGIYALSSTPAFLPFVSTQEWQSHLTPLAQSQQEALQVMLDAFHHLINEDCVKFFTEDGLRYFMRTGRISGIPEVLYTPLSPEERLAVLQRYYQHCQKPGYCAQVLKSSRFQLSHNFFIDLYSNKDILFSYTLSHSAEAFFLLLEQSIADAVVDFLHYIPDSSTLAHPREYTLTVLEEAIAKASGG